MRQFLIFAPLLLMSACSLADMPSDATAPIDRTIDASSQKVFDEIKNPANFPAFALVSNAGSSKRYELELTDDNKAAFGRRDGEAAPIFEKFREGKISIILEANKYAAVELASVSGASRLRYTLHLAEDATGTKTHITSEIDQSNGPLNSEQRAQMDVLMSMMSSMVGIKVIDMIDRRL